MCCSLDTISLFRSHQRASSARHLVSSGSSLVVLNLSPAYAYAGLKIKHHEGKAIFICFEGTFMPLQWHYGQTEYFVLSGRCLVVFCCPGRAWRPQGP